MMRENIINFQTPNYIKLDLYLSQKTFGLDATSPKNLYLPLIFRKRLSGFFQKNTFLKSVDQAEENELYLGSLVTLVKFQTFSYFLVASRTES